VSSNIAQNYPYTSESEAERARTVQKALDGAPDLVQKVATEAIPLGRVEPDARWWVWVCSSDGGLGRLHVAGYSRDHRGVYAVCDTCGKSFLR